MPQRLYAMSKTQPARAIVTLICLLTMAMTGFSLTPWFEAAPTTGEPYEVQSVFALVIFGLFNLLLVVGACGWHLWASWKMNVKHMAKSTFAMFLVWLLSAVNRLVLLDEPESLTWAPFLLVALVLGVCYINLSELRQDNDD